MKTSVIQKLQRKYFLDKTFFSCKNQWIFLIRDNIIRAHKLDCLHISTLYSYRETLWIGTSADILLNLKISQLIDT